jgi:hypothetical protein
LSFVHFFTESHKQPHDGIKASHSPNFTIWQRPGSPFFSVIGGHDTQLIVSSTFGGGGGYVSKNEMPSQFEKMVQGPFHF